MLKLSGGFMRYAPQALWGKMQNIFHIFSDPKSSKVSVRLQLRDQKCEPRGLGESFVTVFPLAFTHFGTHQLLLES